MDGNWLDGGRTADAGGQVTEPAVNGHETLGLSEAGSNDANSLFDGMSLDGAGGVMLRASLTGLVYWRHSSQCPQKG